MTKSKAPLAMMEQMVMLVVFALAAALCLQAFVKSDQMSKRMEAQDRAMALCQNAAELIRQSGGNFNKVAEQLDLEFDQGSTMYRDYDENWEPLPLNEEGAYTLSISGDYDTIKGLGKASLSVWSEDFGTLFELPVAWQEVSVHG